MTKNKVSPRIIISRTDSIGDVVLTLHLTKAIKEKMPDSTLIFLGKSYTKPVLQCCKYVDEIADWSEVESQSKETQNQFLRSLKADIIVHVFPVKNIAYAAKKANIKTRIGTMSRGYHWFTCNTLVWLKRKTSSLHESQLNIKLVSKFFNIQIPTLETLNSNQLLSPPLGVSEKIPNKPFVIIHPKSKGSAREWPVAKYFSLAQMLKDSNHEVVLAGTQDELNKIESEEKIPDYIHNLCGKLSLNEYIAIISQSNGLVAASTGPLHIASALGVNSIGIYAPMKPIHPGRWMPIGQKAKYIVSPKKKCNDCKKTLNCKCITDIEAAEVFEKMKI